MIKRKKKTQKRKNPHLESEAQNILSQFGKNIKFKYLGEGSYAEVYYFIVKNSDTLNPGEYVLKILKDSDLTYEQIQRLKKLSKYGLIPKIYIVNTHYIIMKYINGITLKSLIKVEHVQQYDLITSDLLSNRDLNNILIKVAKLLNKWHDLEFSHGDVWEDNILITNSGKVYLIDPDLRDTGEYDEYKDIRFFKKLYSSINFNLSQETIDRDIKRLFE